MSAAETDVIDLLVGIEPGSRLDEVRAQRKQARENAQKSYLALFAPAEPGDVTALERYAVANFVAGLHRDAVVAPFYAKGLAQHDAGGKLGAAVAAEASAGAVQGPYGAYPEGRLTAENVEGPSFRVSDANRAVLGGKLAAALEHVHMLVFHPRDASAPALQALLDAGWSTTGIVTLSQLVAFLAFQIRVVAGLRVLAEAPAPAAVTA